MTAPVTVSERDLRTLAGIVSDDRTDLPAEGLPPSLLSDLMDQIRCDFVSFEGLDSGVCRLWAATAQCGEHAAFQSGREHEGTISTPWCSSAAGLARGAGLFIALSLAVPLCGLDLC